jgi:hypothetical protein
MDDLLIEGIDDETLRLIQESALRNGRTVDQEAIHLLELGVAAERKEREQSKSTTSAI